MEQHRLSFPLWFASAFLSSSHVPGRWHWALECSMFTCSREWSVYIIGRQLAVNFSADNEATLLPYCCHILRYCIMQYLRAPTHNSKRQHMREEKGANYYLSALLIKMHMAHPSLFGTFRRTEKNFKYPRPRIPVILSSSCSSSSGTAALLKLDSTVGRSRAARTAGTIWLGKKRLKKYVDVTADIGVRLGQNRTFCPHPSSQISLLSRFISTNCVNTHVGLIG